MGAPVYEKMQRDGFCRCCDTLLKRGEDSAIKLYSFRNRGQSIVLCSPCIDKMKNLTKDPK